MKIDTDKPVTMAKLRKIAKEPYSDENEIPKVAVRWHDGSFREGVVSALANPGVFIRLDSGYSIQVVNDEAVCWIPAQRE